MKRKETVPDPVAKMRGTSRRDFLRLATAAGFVGSYAVSTLGQEEIEERPPGPPVSCGVIGIGLHGRRLLTLLARMPEARVKATCELYEPYRRRGVRMAPDATAYSDHDKLLKEADVEAVFVVTPTHLHREIVEAALAAGKHVYCEAPMASTIADARAIAEAAKGSDRIFTVGLQLRANPHYAHALTFLKVRAIGALVSDDSQYHVNSSWQRPVNDPSFREALSWRLSPEVSLGVIGENGVHSFDTTLRHLRQFPNAVTSFGSIMKWKDGRETPDTVQCVFEFPSGFQSRFESTLTNSYGGRPHAIHGTHGTVVLAEKRAWLFKEADAPSLGWEVYALRERVVMEDGIVLVADATKLLERNELPGDHAEEELAKTEDAIFTSTQAFLRAVGVGETPSCGYKEGYQSTVMAVMAHRALQEGKRVEIDPTLFEI